MPWFKVDDKLHDHRKARSAGATAMGVWVLAGSWAADNLTDGFIPATILPRWGRPRDANRLVEVGLWFADEQDGEGGWRFHEWDERQPTRAQKLEERALKAEAGRIGGQASGRSRREAKAKQSAKGQVELPSRPDPSRPEVPSGTSRDGQSDSSRFPDFWATYPRRVDRGHALKAFAKAVKNGAEAQRIIDAAGRFAAKTQGSDPKFIPHAATWLNGERWLDEDGQGQLLDAGPREVFRLPTPPAEIADDPTAYRQWVHDQRAQWDARQAGGDR